MENNYDNVNNPKHYAGDIECIDAILQTQGVLYTYIFCKVNAFKYLWRYRNKNLTEDIEKTAWYTNKAVELMRTYFSDTEEMQKELDILVKEINSYTSRHPKQVIEEEPVIEKEVEEKPKYEKPVAEVIYEIPEDTK